MMKYVFLILRSQLIYILVGYPIRTPLLVNRVGKCASEVPVSNGSTSICLASFAIGENGLLSKINHLAQ